MSRRIYDISPLVSADLKVWPGDTPPSREVLFDMASGANMTLSSLHATVHLGAHADAPSHYSAEGVAIAERPLELYLGPCQLIRVDVGRRERVGVEHLEVGVVAPRVIIATNTYPDPNAFNKDFAAIAPGLLDELAKLGVRLIGIDTPSVDLYDSKDLPAHNRCLAHDMAILEGLVLDGIDPGLYELIALPLKLAAFDASPVRAILRSID